MTTTLTDQARRESGLGLSWATALTLAAPNGPPNGLPDPLADTVGFDTAGFVWGVYALRCDPGTSCTFRVHVRWAGLATGDDGWDEVEASDKAISLGRGASTRIRIAGAARVYIELLTVVGGGNVKVLWSNATGVT